MLLFPFFKIYFVTITFLLLYEKNNLGTFSHSILYEKGRRKKCQKMPINSLVKGVTFNVAKIKNYRHLMTRKHRIRTNTNEKVPKNAEQYYCNCGKMLLGFLFYRLLMST